MPAPLISLARAKIAFPNLVDTTQDPTIQVLIDAASRAIERFCKRVFSLTTWDEVYDSDGTGSILLRNFPVLSLTRVAQSPTDVLNIQNTLNPNTQVPRATVATTLPNASDWPAASSGLVLTRVDSSGNVNTDATLTWVANPTINAVAAAVNAVGNGWKATPLPNFGIWPSADIVAIQGASSALLSGANLRIHTQDLSTYDFNPETAELRLTGGFDPILFSAGWAGGTFMPDLVPGIEIPRGSRFLRVTYTAGFNVIPDDLQNACALLTAHMYAHPAQAGELISESIGDYSYTRQNLDRLPAKVLSYIYPYRDYRT